MRLDKFLKVSRVIKRRTISKELAASGRVSVNGKVVKPSYTLNIGYVLDIELGDRIITIKILNLREFASKDQADSLYEVVKETFKEKEDIEF